MDNRKIYLKKIIKEYLKNIPSNIKVASIFLFGSYATGKMRRDSDLDLVVISANFKKVDFMQRLILLSHAQGASKITRSVPMDVVGYTPEEFKNAGKESIIMRRAKKEGKVIYKA